MASIFHMASLFLSPSISRCQQRFQAVSASVKRGARHSSALAMPEYSCGWVGVSPPRPRATLSSGWLHSDLCTSLGLGQERQRWGQGEATATLSHHVLRAGRPMMGQGFKSLTASGGHGHRLPTPSSRVLIAVCAAS